MNPHVDAEVLAELAEGLLDDETTAQATAHLRDCAECREVADALAAVSHVLAATPAPALPAHVAEGIDARLADEAAARRMGEPVPAEPLAEAPAEAPAEPAAEAEVVSLSSARRLRWSRALAAAAAAVVLVGGGFTVARDMLQQREAASDAPLASQGGGGGSGESDQLRAKAAAPTVRTGTDYTAAGLSTQAETLVRRVPSNTPAEPKIGVEGGAPSAGVAGCLARIADRTGRTVLLADEARYEGDSATLVVLSGRSADTAEVLVIPGDCTAADSAVARRVTVPRG